MSSRTLTRAAADPTTTDPNDPVRFRPRRKPAIRRLLQDLRSALPLLGLVLCFGLSATAIFATEWLPANAESIPAVAAAPPIASECTADLTRREPSGAPLAPGS